MLEFLGMFKDWVGNLQAKEIVSKLKTTRVIPSDCIRLTLAD